MCGIFGYIGKKDSITTVLNGLKKLEYRGYDSAGIAGLKDGQIFSCKAVGKISNLEEKLQSSHFTADLAIAHTRWATHGKPSEVNAHPHFDTSRTLALVHNGIIENYEELKTELTSQGIVFQSQTDTEVVAHLVSYLYEGDILKTIQQVIRRLKGSYAIALIHQDYPHQIMAFANQSPLVIGLGNHEVFISSDSNAFTKFTRQVVFVSNNEIALLNADKIELFNLALEHIEPKQEQLEASVEVGNKGDFEHYTLKEIYEQPQTIINALQGRLLEDYGTAYFDGLHFNTNSFLGIKRILILACGTSWHAGYVGAYLFEDQARLPVQVEISSEFRYKNPIVPSGTFVIAISQSGETADTIAAVRELKAKGAHILALCNVPSSTLAREANDCIYLRAGPEIGVCSTKAFTNQFVVLSLLSLMMSRMRHLPKEKGQLFIHELRKLPEQVQRVLDQASAIKAIANKYSHYENFFFLGRNYMFPTSLEGALKLKEISYINANGYPAGEMKHGPIALINEMCPTVALCANRHTYEKMLSNLMEVKARSGPIIAIAEEESAGIEAIADDVIYIPKTIDALACIPSTIVTQLLAYYIAEARGTDIDQPRNLAKSVTVE